MDMDDSFNGYYLRANTVVVLFCSDISNDDRIAWLHHPSQRGPFAVPHGGTSEQILPTLAHFLVLGIDWKRPT